MNAGQPATPAQADPVTQTLDRIREKLTAIHERKDRIHNASRASITRDGNSLTIKTYATTPFNVTQLIDFAQISLANESGKYDLKKGYPKGRNYAANSKGDINSIPNAEHLIIAFDSTAKMETFLARLESGLTDYVATLGDPVSAQPLSHRAKLATQPDTRSKGRN